jgi:hypothetical protein
MDFVGAALFISLTAFVRVFLGTGRKWLAFLGPVVMCVPLILDLLPQPKALFLELPTLRTVQTFGGATYTVADGVRNPLLWVFYLGVLLILIFVADASVASGARGHAAGQRWLAGPSHSLFWAREYKRLWWMPESYRRRI